VGGGVAASRVVVDRMIVIVPIKTHSSNELHRMHWRKYARIVKAQREAVRVCMVGNVGPALPIRIHLKRIAPGTLDSHDNLRGALKAVADEVCAVRGIKDDDPRVTFEYSQERKGKGNYAVWIEITSNEGIHCWAARASSARRGATCSTASARCAGS
jgi:hypothetical protein